MQILQNIHLKQAEQMRQYQALQNPFMGQVMANLGANPANPVLDQHNSLQIQVKSESIHQFSFDLNFWKI